MYAWCPESMPSARRVPMVMAWFGLALKALLTDCVTAHGHVRNVDAPACLRSQGNGRWTVAAGKHHPQRRWSFMTPVGEGLGCSRKNGTADWHENVVALGFDFDNCPLEQLNLKRLCTRLAGRELLFVGDSLQVHLFIEFYMMANHTYATTSRMCKHYTCRSRYICTDHVPGGVPIEVMRDDYLSLPGEHAPHDVNGNKPMVHSNRWIRSLSNKTVVILTAGSHYWEPANHRAHLVKFALAMKQVMTALPGLRVVYRSATAGHRNCNETKSPLSSLTGPRASSFLPRADIHDSFSMFGWHHIEAARPANDESFRSLGAAILEAWTPAAYRPDMHPPHLDTLHHHIDCLHFCPGEAVYYTWALTLANMIQAWDLLE
mmetsp:Transcript_1249/g.3511  ORF Transcript_1249/g.3511 Transcript_1249/m.3511 type:complete len:375 (+) Transcript_1249:62-1186(+)